MIIFPMAGLSRRFGEAGYDRPKYMLPLDGGTCFDFSVAGFVKAYAEDTFVFVMRDVQDTPRFVEQRLRALGVRRSEVVVLDGPTSGQGETVEKGLAAAGGAETPGTLTIFNIDTFRINVLPPASSEQGDGYLEIFTGSGTGWSFVEPEPGSANKVRRTTEKVPVSDLCCTGLYNFGNARLFLEALEAERHAPTSALPETYVAPVYNHLIRRGYDIRYSRIPREDVVFCGVPTEYEALRRDPSPLQRLVPRQPA